MRLFKTRNKLDVLLNFLIGILLVYALGLLLVRFAPFSFLRVVLSAAGTETVGIGGVRHPAEAGIRALINRLPYFSGFFALFAATLALFKSQLRDFLSGIPEERPTIAKAFRDFFPPNKETWLEIGVLLLIVTIGIIFRIWDFGRPAFYDEADTYFQFASKSLLRGLSYYPYPNNHLFHTFLVHLSIHIFPDTRWALRLPAFLAGCATIPLSWLTGRLLYGRLAGILTSGWTAALLPFLEFSINARGYSLQWVFVLALMCFAAVLHNEPSLRTAWVGFVLAGIAGFYTIPTMVIPILGVMCWLLLSSLAPGGGDLWDMSRRLTLAGLAMALLSVTLYFPPILSTGLSSVVSNRYVAPIKFPFLNELALVVKQIWLRWFEGVPVPFLWLLALGLAIGFIWNRRVSAFPVPMTIVLCLFVFVYCWIRNIVGGPRVWIFLLLALVITSSAGLALLIQLLARHSTTWQLIAAAALPLLFASITGTSLIRQHRLIGNNEVATIYDAKEIADFLAREMHPGDGLIIGPLADQILKYELLQRDRKLYTSLISPESACRITVVSPKAAVYWGFPIVGDIIRRMNDGPDWVGDQISLDALRPPELLADFPTVRVYEFQKKSSDCVESSK